MLEITQDTLQLWAMQIVPALFPYMVLSSLTLILLNRFFSINNTLFRKIIYKIFHLSVPGTFILIAGQLCGYPIGAKLISDAITNQQITEEEGIYLLTICNQSSPAFLRYYVCDYILNSTISYQSIYILFYLSTFITSFFTRIIYSYSSNQEPYVNSSKRKIKLNTYIHLFDQCITENCTSILKVGGYIILFSLFSNLILSITSTNNALIVILLSTFEITTGLNQLQNNYANKSWYLPIILIITAFGGFSTMAQIKGMLLRTSLSIKSYIIGKIIYIIILLLLFLLLSKIKIISFFI